MENEKKKELSGILSNNAISGGSSTKHDIKFDTVTRYRFGVFDKVYGNSLLYNFIENAKALSVNCKKLAFPKPTMMSFY